MAEWDANSPELLRNFKEVGQKVTADAAARRPVSSEAIREWQAHIMRGLEPTDGETFGAFRGEPGLETYNVGIGDRLGSLAEHVASELVEFNRKLTERLAELDRTIRREHFDEDSTADDVNAVIILCAWAHGEWVRIHPFPNGNGRTARILVNSIAQRYRLPAFMRIRPRPGVEYELIARQAMDGNWQAAIPLFLQMYAAAL